MELGEFLGGTGILAFPEKILPNVAGQKSEKNPGHERVVNHANSGQGIGNEVERVDQIHEAEESAHQGPRGPLAIAAGEEIAEHGGCGADQAGNIGEFGARTKRVQGFK